MSPASDIILSSTDYERASQKIQISIDQSRSGEQQSYLREVVADMQTEYRHPDLRKFLSFYMNNLGHCWIICQRVLLILDDFHKIADKQAQFEKNQQSY